MLLSRKQPMSLCCYVVMFLTNYVWTLLSDYAIQGIPFTPVDWYGSVWYMGDPRILVPGVDYPRTFQEIDEWFRSDAACHEYIRRLRWPDGFICPGCQWTGEPRVTLRGLFQCRSCQRQTS